MRQISIRKEEWDEALVQLLDSHTIFATFSNESGLDYELTNAENIKLISYNHPKPSTSLKTFFLPVRENVTTTIGDAKKRVIIGVPNCDIEALAFLDSIYLDGEFNDIFYKERREKTVLISCDCLSINENCHCLAYGIKPKADNADISAIELDGDMIIDVQSEKGDLFIKALGCSMNDISEDARLSVAEKHRLTEEALHKLCAGLPDYLTTGALISKTDKAFWQKKSEKCVSCGACTAICPTCTCFLLIDRPGFEKIKQMDACQYPGFERVAGGEDALFELPVRFKNRYMCKYVWKPAKFTATACTGCGRCIDACIGKINKNEILRELAKSND